MLLADALGNIFFGSTLVGGEGWFMIVGHVMNWWTLPKKKK